MSTAYDSAQEILSNPERWVADEGHRFVVVYKDAGQFGLAEIENVNPPYLTDSIDNKLWFQTLESAKMSCETAGHLTSNVDLCLYFLSISV